MKTTEIKKKYKVTRDAVVTAALSMLGWRFRHQARGEANSVDCVGLLVVVGRKIKYPYVETEIVYRVTKPKHIGLIFHSGKQKRVDELLGIYTERITNDFLAVAPAKERYDD